MNSQPPGRIPGDRFLHSPGPTHIPAEVLNAMHRQPMDHGDPRLEQLIAVCETGLRRLLQTDQADVFLYISNGHGAWEATIENLLAPGQAVLIPGSGHFSEQWAIQVEATGRRVVRTPYREGYPIDPGGVEQALRADKQRDIVAVFTVHTDTASSATCDLKAIRAAIDAAGHPALFVADVVASLGAAPFAMDALGVNVAVGASQKGLMLPPGLSFNAVSDKARKAAQSATLPRSYWAWEDMIAANKTGYFPYTPATNLLYGLRESIKMLREEGLPQVFARHARHAEATRRAVRAWDLEILCANAEEYSNTLTAVMMPAGHDADALRKTILEAYDMSLGTGLGRLAGKIFRIGHLGDFNDLTLMGTLAGVEMGLALAKVPHKQGGVAAAMTYLTEAAGSRNAG